jgi:predicted TIM-barrel fold metal-dependent hydrolase
MKHSILLTAALCLPALSLPAQDPSTLLLENYRPQSIYHIPVTTVEKARVPVIDMHSHDYATSPEELDQWVENMKAAGIERTVILSYATGEAFDDLVDRFRPYMEHFELWCGIDYAGYKEPGWEGKAIAELERCHALGAKGIGELGDKGKGLLYSRPTPAPGMHLDDVRLDAVLDRAGELGMPVNIHVAEPIWMYAPMDSTNDGLMNAYYWKVDLSEPGTLDHGELIGTLERAVAKHPGTTFIACHFANCSYDLSILARLLDRYPNLFADISARYGETAPIPRYMHDFYVKYQDRLLYGTDMGFGLDMYRTTFRILETEDEHFYAMDHFKYHWPLHGFGLPEGVLQKLYRGNALKIKKLNSRP